MCLKKKNLKLFARMWDWSLSAITLEWKYSIQYIILDRGNIVWIAAFKVGRESLISTRTQFLLLLSYTIKFVLSYVSFIRRTLFLYLGGFCVFLILKLTEHSARERSLTKWIWLLFPARETKTKARTEWEQKEGMLSFLPVRDVAAYTFCIYHL